MTRPLVVVTDTDPTYLAMMTDMLDYAGYEAIPVRKDGCAFGIICARQPALVIIELLITAPERGLRILDQMRGHGGTSTIPVIAASTNPLLLRAHSDRLRDQHCATLPKPFDFEELLDLIQRHAPLEQHP